MNDNLIYNGKGSKENSNIKGVIYPASHLWPFYGTNLAWQVHKMGASAWFMKTF